MDAFTEQYLITALWSSNDESTPQGGEPMDKRFTVKDFTEAIAKAEADCKAFQEQNADDLTECDDGTAGHDFWLTRNGHGAGFWDGDYEEEMGQRLTESSKRFGECNLYIGDDGKVHMYPS
jgi:hypothetical protein